MMRVRERMPYEERTGGHPRIESDWRIARLIDGIAAGDRGALNLYLRWKVGELVFDDPAAGQGIVTLEDGRACADTAEARVLDRNRHNHRLDAGQRPVLECRQNRRWLQRRRSRT